MGDDDNSQNSQKGPKIWKLKHGHLEVIGYTTDTPMTIRMKVKLRNGVERVIGKF